MSNYINAPVEGPLDITPVGGRIGAVVSGVDLATLDDALVPHIRAAILRHKVLFFGDQQLDDAGQEAFAARLGQVVGHPTLKAQPGTSHLLEVNADYGRGANSWHTDITFIDAYPAFSLLRSIVVPQAGGNTLWANTATAYEDLPEPLRELADRLWTVHSNVFDYAEAGGHHRRKDEFRSTYYETEHPLVRVHPETGERVLLAGHFINRAVGLSPTDWNPLYQIFQRYVTRPENVVAWRWREGDLAVFDNRATQHYAPSDFGQQRRIIRRATVAGEVPVGVDGRYSRILVPAPAHLEAAE